MKRILCPTDFSEAAHNGIAYAAKLAQLIGSELTLLNVQSRFDLVPFDVIGGKNERIDLITEQLEEQSIEVMRAFKVSCSSEVVQTIRPLSSIISTKAKKYDFVVMGSNGPDDLYQLFAGSNTYNTILHTQTPMLVVPAGCVFTSPRKIVYAYNYLKEGTLPLMTPLVSFAKLLQSDVTILQIMEEGYSTLAEEELLETQQVILRVNHSDINIEFSTLHSGNIPAAIHEYVHQHDVDMLALCCVHRNMISRLFHRSVLKELTAVSEYPLFVFPE
jgi:nucleotide-binding universal stress UspA family protein